MNASKQIATGMLGLLLAGSPATAQSPRNFVQQVFGTSAGATEPMLGDAAPGFSLLIASQEPKVLRTARPDVVRLVLDGIPLRFEMRHEQIAGIDLYRIRQARGSPLRGEHIRFTDCPAGSLHETPSRRRADLAGIEGGIVSRLRIFEPQEKRPPEGGRFFADEPAAPLPRTDSNRRPGD